MASTMSNRLTQIATRTGDDGTTGLGDGSRVGKDHLRIAAMGEVDELNSNLGVLLAEPLPDDVRELLSVIQHELFNLGGELSIPGFALLKIEAVARLDTALAHYTRLAAAQGVICGGHRSEALAHVGHTVARRRAGRWSPWRRGDGAPSRASPQSTERPAFVCAGAHRANLEAGRRDEVTGKRSCARRRLSLDRLRPAGRMRRL